MVNQDCKKISNAMSEVVVKRCTEKLGYSNVACRFEFVESDEFAAKDYVELAEKLQKIGLKIDSKKLKEVTKLEIIDDSETTWTPSSNAKAEE